MWEKREERRKIPKIVGYLSCSAGCTHFAQTKSQEASVFNFDHKGETAWFSVRGDLKTTPPLLVICLGEDCPALLCLVASIPKMSNTLGLATWVTPNHRHYPVFFISPKDAVLMWQLYWEKMQHKRTDIPSYRGGFQTKIEGPYSVLLWICL